MKTKMTNETKTGILVLVCLAALTALVMKVGNFSLFRHGYLVKSQFHYTAGVKKHAPVRLSGVDVGEVRDIRIVYGDDTLIELSLWLEEGVKMRADSKAYVTTLGLMGEKYIEVLAGSSSAPYAKEGDVIPAEDPVRLEDLVKLGTKLAEDVSKTAKDISKLANDIDTAVVDNKPKLDRIFDNLEDTSANFRDFSEDIKYNPWKVLARGKEKTKEDIAREKAQKTAQTQAANLTGASKSNFKSR